MPVYLYLCFIQEEMKILSFNLYQSNQSPEKSMFYPHVTSRFQFFLEDTEFWSKGAL